MQNRFLMLACVLVITMGSIAVPFPDGAIAVLVVGIMSAIALVIVAAPSEMPYRIILFSPMFFKKS